VEIAKFSSSHRQNPVILLHELNIPRDVRREVYLVGLSQLIHIINAKRMKG